MKLVLIWLSIICCNAVFGQNYLMRFGNLNNNEGLDIAHDNNGFTFSTGYFTNTVNFGTFPKNSVGLSDIYVVKTSNTGNVLWAFSGGGTGPDRGNAITVLQDGSSVITGFYSSSATFGSFTLNANSGSQDFFVLKLDPDGNAEWAKSFGGELGDTGFAINSDNAGNIVVTGQFKGTADFEGTVFTSTTHAETGEPSFDIFVLKLDSDGNVLWAKHGQNSLDSRGLGISTDSNLNVYVCGQFSDTLTFDNTHSNDLINAAFVVRFDPDGSESWFRHFTSSLTAANGIAIGDSDEVYITGDNLGPILFYSPTGIQLFPAEYSSNVFLARLESNGNLNWLTYNGSFSPVSSRGVALDPFGNPYIAGTFRCRFEEYSLEFDTGIFYSAGEKDIYISKFNPQGERLWSRHMASIGDCNFGGISVPAENLPHINGSFRNDFVVTDAPTFNPIAGNAQSNYNPPLCGDNFYGAMRWVTSQGNRDIFLTSPINLSRQPLDYFVRQTNPPCNRVYLPPCIHSCLDTLTHCGPAYAFYHDNTVAPLNPIHDFEWISPIGGPPFLIGETGMYYWEYERADGCESFSGSLMGIIHDEPVPTISDNLMVNDFAIPDASAITICIPDSVLLMGSNFNETDTYTWLNLENENIITTDADSAIYVTGTGVYTFTIEDEMGCFNTNFVEVFAYIPLTEIFGSIGIQGEEPVDTVFVCANSQFSVFVVDNNPNSNWLEIMLENCVLSWSIEPGTAAIITTGALSANVIAQESGLYLIQLTIINLCDGAEFIIEREVYIHLYPEPELMLAINGDNNICPGDTALIYATGAIGNYNWGPGSYIQLSNDSILAWMIGGYSVSAVVENEFGCMANQSQNFNLVERNPPIVSMSPANGIICPEDSVQLTTEAGLAYQWFGPDGLMVGNQQSIWVNIPGTYFCVLTDIDSCVLESNQVEVEAYASPYLVTFPGIDICLEGAIEIQVVTPAGSIILWEPPISSNAQFVTVDEPGVYTCSVTLCGITTTQSITVVETEVNAFVNIDGPSTICEGDSVLLQGNIGMAGYEWLPGGQQTPNIWVTEPGEYTLITSDPQGCEGISTPIVIDGSPEVFLAQSDTLEICPGDSVLLSAQGDYPFYLWSPGGETEAEIWAGTAGTYFLTVTDTFGCDGVSNDVLLIELPIPETPGTVELIHCAGDEFNYLLETDAEITWWISGETFDSNPIVLENLQSDTVIYYSVSGNNNCFSFTDSIAITVIAEEFFPVIYGNQPVCAGDTLLLFTDSDDIFEYEWLIDGTTVSQSSELLLYGPGTSSDNTTVQLIVDAAGCAEGLTEIDLDINQPPDALPLLGLGVFCAGDTVVVSTNSSDPLQLLWSWDNQESDQDAIEITSSQNDSILITLIGISGECPGIPTTGWVVFHPYPQFTDLDSNSPVCAGESLTLWAEASPVTNITATGPNGNSWDLPHQFNTATLELTGMYTVVAINRICSVNEDIWLEVLPSPEVALGEDVEMCMGNTVSFSLSDYDNVIWNGFWESESYQTTQNEMVTVEVINEFGCTYIDSVQVGFYNCDGPLDNVFSPNNDGINDQFNFNPYNYDDISVWIYNRWGQVICMIDNQNNWDGRHCQTGEPVSDGIYFYTMEYKTLEGEHGTKKGTIHVFR